MPDSHSLSLSLGLTGQVCAWVGIVSWPAVISISLTLAKLVLVVCGYLQKDHPLWEFQRMTRRNIVLAQFLMTSAVEAAVITNRLLLAAIWASKWGAVFWFLKFGRADGKASGLTWDKSWCVPSPARRPCSHCSAGGATMTGSTC